MRRRHFLELTFTAAGAIQAKFASRSAGALLLPQKSLRVPLRFFTTDEAHLIAAAAAHIFPSDESGAGANEAGVVIYIDRQLAGPYGRDRYRYTQAPFEDGVPDVGYQGKATPRDIYRQGLKTLAGFDDMDAALHSIEGTLFFTLLRTHTIEGMFCDPMHGGNADMVGWRLIGFPGPRMSYADELGKYHGREFRPAPQSLEQATGQRVHPSEDDT